MTEVKYTNCKYSAIKHFTHISHLFKVHILPRKASVVCHPNTYHLLFDERRAFVIFLEYRFGCGQFTWPQLQLPCSEEVFTWYSWLRGNSHALSGLFYTWVGYTATMLCKHVAGFLLSAQQSGQKWWNVINFYLRFIALTAGNRTIASSYWGSSEQYAVKKLDYNCLRGSHTPRTSGTPQMFIDIAFSLNWIKRLPTSAVCLHWIIIYTYTDFYREQVQGIKRHKT